MEFHSENLRIRQKSTLINNNNKKVLTQKQFNTLFDTKTMRIQIQRNRNGKLVIINYRCKKREENRQPNEFFDDYYYHDYFSLIYC